MNSKINAVLKKEWIKLRFTGWLLPLMVIYAAVDAYLFLHGQDQLRGVHGLWDLIISRQPLFFISYRLLALCGVLLGFFQFWPECQGKRLRLFFHMPVEPSRLLSVQILIGMGVLAATNMLAFGLLFGSLRVFMLPMNVVTPILSAMAPWALLSFIAYFVTGAFLAAKKLPLRLLVLIAGYCAYAMLYDGAGYGQFSEAMWRYTLFAIGFIPFVYYTYLRFLSNPTFMPEFSFVRAASLCVVLVGLSTVLPELYWRVAIPEKLSQSLLYSPVSNEFVQVISSTKRKIGEKQKPGSIYLLEDGTELERREYCQLLPHFYGRDLEKWGMFPEVIGGKSTTPMQMMGGWTSDRFNSSFWNSPKTMLRTLLEAEPNGASFVSPDDFFRLACDGMGLEFLRAETGSVDVEKSDRFNKALKAEGFVFPILVMNGNSNLMKGYDVGHFLVDSNNVLFQLQMVEGWPRCVNSKQQVPGTALGIKIKEKPLRRHYGFVVSTEGIYAINMNNPRLNDNAKGMDALNTVVSNKVDMSLQRLPIDNFDPHNIEATMYTTIAGNSLQMESLDSPMEPEQGLGLNDDLAIVHSFRQPKDPQDIKAMAVRNQVESFLFPLRFEKWQPFSGFIRFVPVCPDYPWIALVSGLISACLVFVYYRARKATVRKVDLLLAGVFGPATLIVVILANWDAPLKILKRA